MKRLRDAASRRLLQAWAAVVLLAVKVSLRAAPVWTIRAASGRRVTGGASDHALVSRLAAAVESLGCVTLFMSDCLSRSVTVLILARCAGVHPRLVIGARRSRGGLDAHAWLSCTADAPAVAVDGHAPLWIAP